MLAKDIAMPYHNENSLKYIDCIQEDIIETYADDNKSFYKIDSELEKLINHDKNASLRRKEITEFSEDEFHASFKLEKKKKVT